MKKIILIAAGLLVSASAFASAPCPDNIARKSNPAKSKKIASMALNTTTKSQAVAPQVKTNSTTR